MRTCYKREIARHGVYDTAKNPESDDLLNYELISHSSKVSFAPVVFKTLQICDELPLNSHQYIQIQPLIEQSVDSGFLIVMTVTYVDDKTRNSNRNQAILTRNHGSGPSQSHRQ
jgi:hypothetical protein